MIDIETYRLRVGLWGLSKIEMSKLIYTKMFSSFIQRALVVCLVVRVFFNIVSSNRKKIINYLKEDLIIIK